MTEDEIYARVTDVLADNFDIDRAKISRDASFRRTLRLDSLEVVDLVYFLHEAFQYKSELKDYYGVQTVGELVAFLKNRVG